MGGRKENAGIWGNGMGANLIRQSLQKNGITHIGQDRLDEDSGFRVVLTPGSPKKTFIASYGAEAHGDADTFKVATATSASDTAELKVRGIYKYTSESTVDNPLVAARNRENSLFTNYQTFSTSVLDPIG